MWNIYLMLTESIIQDKGILDEYLDEVFVCFINFMNKDPEFFKTGSFGQNTTCLEICCQLIALVFKNAEEKDDELEAICGVTLVNAMFENLQGISHIIPGIIDLYLDQLGKAEIPEYKMVLNQGIMMCLWYDANTTLGHLEQLQATSHVIMNFIQQTENCTKDFEVKRFMLGYSALLIPQQMP